MIIIQNADSFFTGVASSLVAAAIGPLIVGGVLYFRRFRRSRLYPITGTWVCEWQTASEGLAPVEQDTVSISHNWRATLSVETSDVDLPWKARGTIAADRRHIVLSWEMPHSSGMAITGTSVLYVATDCSFLAGHWYGESVDGKQTYGWSVLYRSQNNRRGVNESARLAALQWIGEGAMQLANARPMSPPPVSEKA